MSLFWAGTSRQFAQNWAARPQAETREDRQDSNDLVIALGYDFQGQSRKPIWDTVLYQEELKAFAFGMRAQAQLTVLASHPRMTRELTAGAAVAIWERVRLLAGAARCT